MLSRILRPSKAFVTHIKGKKDIQKFQKGNYILNFSATWCGPCKQMQPITKKKEEEAKVDIDAQQNQQLNQQFRVQAVPTMVYFKNGKQVHRTVGGLSAQKFDQAVKKIQ